MNKRNTSLLCIFLDSRRKKSLATVLMSAVTLFPFCLNIRQRVRLQILFLQNHVVYTPFSVQFVSFLRSLPLFLRGVHKEGERRTERIHNFSHILFLLLTPDLLLGRPFSRQFSFTKRKRPLLLSVSFFFGPTKVFPCVLFTSSLRQDRYTSFHHQ